MNTDPRDGAKHETVTENIVKLKHLSMAMEKGDNQSFEFAPYMTRHSSENSFTTRDQKCEISSTNPLGIVSSRSFVDSSGKGYSSKIQSVSGSDRERQLLRPQNTLVGESSLLNRRKFALGFSSNGRQPPKVLCLHCVPNWHSLDNAPLLWKTEAYGSFTADARTNSCSESAILVTQRDLRSSPISSLNQSVGETKGSRPKTSSSVYSTMPSSSGLITSSCTSSYPTFFPSFPKRKSLKSHKVKIINGQNLSNRVRSLVALNLSHTAEVASEAFKPYESSEITTWLNVETVLPTPRRSHGWWNLIFSPFSAISAQFPDAAASNFSNPEHVVPEEPLSLNKSCSKENAPETGDRTSTGNHCATEIESKSDRESITAIEKPLNDFRQRDLADCKSFPAILSRRTTDGTPCNEFSPPQIEISNSTLLSSPRWTINDSQSMLPLCPATVADSATQKHFALVTYMDVNSQSVNAIKGDTKCDDLSHPAQDTEACRFKNRHARIGYYFSEWRRGSKLPRNRGIRLQIITGVFLSCVMALSLVLSISITRPYRYMPLDPFWVNGTVYPPLPTGVMQVTNSRLVVQNIGCVQPSSLWSCSVTSSSRDNSTEASETKDWTIEIRDLSSPYSSSSNSRLVALLGPRRRDTESTVLYSPNPLPPSMSEQTFLGNTTDHVDIPYSGIETPFAISIVALSDFPSALRKRTNSDKTSKHRSYIPPTTNSKGSALVEIFSPFPMSQPLMLFNVGQASEHYGFYTYFDRSVFINSSSSADITGQVAGHNSSTPDTSPARSQHRQCTFSQTRMHVQIWTRAESTSKEDQMLNDKFEKPPSRAQSRSKLDSNSGHHQIATMPLPITFTIDRHGGDAGRKGVHCYGIDGMNRVIYSDEIVLPENRSFGGTLVNPATEPFSSFMSNRNYGGIDGGTGGCKCSWNS